MTISTAFKQAEDLILYVLENNPETHGSDMELVLAVWREQGVEMDSFTTNQIRQAMSPETIRRTRQKLNAQGLFLPSKTVQNGRKRLGEEHRAYHRAEKTTIVSEPEEIKEQKIVGYKDMNVNGKNYHLPIYG